MNRASVAAAVEALQARFGDRVVTTQAVREQHGRDEGWHDAIAPDAVVFAESTDEVAAVVRTCAEHRVPVIAFGAGTSLEGHVAALRGGISLDLTGLNRIVEVNGEDLDCTVEAGVRRKQLNDRLNREGLIFPIDPGADATIGGMASTRASGTNAVRYGTMRENVLGLTVVLPSGEVIRTGTRARKSSAGYDLTRLLVGSEGTLGVITEVTLRLYGIPEVIGGAVCSFASLAGAVDTVIQTIQLGVPVARIELLDERMVAACNDFSGLDLPEAPLLLLEFHGTDIGVADQAGTVEGLASANGGTGWQWSTDTQERSRLWQARHDAYYAAKALRPGAKAFPTDVCVPISKLADCILETRADIDRSGLIAPLVGHVGDGNFHLLVLFDEDDAEERRAALGLNERLIERALAVGGTCTGEHGVGYGKLDFMRAEHGPAELATMRAIKLALDPHDIMNPGKVVPAVVDTDPVPA
ncbi:MAG TPA: FAD-linked oxidase C-terminal domain-containing protein [Nitriliruptorales bacterium]